jgi:hypothetical protein
MLSLARLVPLRLEADGPARAVLILGGIRVWLGATDRYIPYKDRWQQIRFKSMEYLMVSSYLL